MWKTTLFLEVVQLIFLDGVSFLFAAMLQKMKEKS